MKYDLAVLRIWIQSEILIFEGYLEIASPCPGADCLLVSSGEYTK